MTSYDDVGRIPRHAFVVIDSLDLPGSSSLNFTGVNDATFHCLHHQRVCSILYPARHPEGICS